MTSIASANRFSWATSCSTHAVAWGVQPSAIVPDRHGASQAQSQKATGPSTSHPMFPALCFKYSSLAQSVPRSRSGSRTNIEPAPWSRGAFGASFETVDEDAVVAEGGEVDGVNGLYAVGVGERDRGLGLAKTRRSREGVEPEGELASGTRSKRTGAVVGGAERTEQISTHEADQVRARGVGQAYPRRLAGPDLHIAEVQLACGNLTHGANTTPGKSVDGTLRRTRTRETHARGAVVGPQFARQQAIDDRAGRAHGGRGRGAARSTTDLTTECAAITGRCAEAAAGVVDLHRT